MEAPCFLFGQFLGNVGKSTHSPTSQGLCLLFQSPSLALLHIDRQGKTISESYVQWKRAVDNEESPPYVVFNILSYGHQICHKPTTLPALELNSIVLFVDMID
jgi:hypothetical protein